MENIVIPKHVGIIMDGNGRWAKMRGKKRSFGHLEGSKTLENIALYAIECGIQVLSVYAFSTDNFKRSKEEVDYLMNLFITMFNKKMQKIKDNDIKVIFSGRREPLREDVLASIDKIVEETKNNKRGILNICLNYGGQEEIVDATKKIVELVNNGELNIGDIDKNSFYKYLYNDLPDLDFVIRTSGEERISNFMLWQISYAEFYFPKVYFPDFDEKEFDKALEIYNNRNRRFGGN